MGNYTDGQGEGRGQRQVWEDPATQCGRTREGGGHPLRTLVLFVLLW